jgi:hypothetical protein
MEDLAESRERSGSPDEVAVALGTKELRLRKATGRDQRAWMERRFGDEPAARRFMIGTLVTQWSGPEPFDSEGLSEESLDLIDGEMREADPLVYFTISTSCPACGASMTCEADFEQLALSTFSGAQRRLIEEVHRFAYYYNWSEDQVFDVPVWRRRRFLSLIDKEHSS